MNAPIDRRVGWCPGVLRPMPAGDGLLIRVKPRCSRLSLAAARGLASAARTFGNGVLTITGRANIQIRGAANASLPDLTALLREADLVDPTPEGEAARNVLCSPLAGRDAAALLDVTPLVAGLETALTQGSLFQSLPAKFNWSVDDGGSLGFDALSGDIRFSAVRVAGTIRFAIALAGSTTTGVCDPDHLVTAATRLAETFLSSCTAHGVSPHRMRDLVAVCAPETLLAQARIDILEDRLPVRPSVRPIGQVTSGQSSTAVGVAPAFGRLEAGTLEAFVSAAASAGAADLRLTPWRSILVAGLDKDSAAPLLAAAAEVGLIADPGDPRLTVAVCAGEPACGRSGGPVQVHAARWTRFMRSASSIQLHISGCPKGCAHANAAPLTLVARQGAYDLVRRGRAGDPPVATGLSVDAVETLLAGEIGPHAEAAS